MYTKKLMLIRMDREKLHQKSKLKKSSVAHLTSLIPLQCECILKSHRKKGLQEFFRNFYFTLWKKNILKMHLLIIILLPLIAERWFFINFAGIKWQMAIFRELTTII